MATITAGKTYHSFVSVMKPMERFVPIIGRVLFYGAWPLLGALAWYLLSMTENSLVTRNVFFGISIIAFMLSLMVPITVSSSREGNFFDIWTLINDIVGLLLLSVVVLELLIAGPHISVPEDSIRFSRTGEVYFPGDVARREYWRPQPILINRSSDKSIEWFIDDTLPNNQLVTNVKTTATIHEELRPGVALKNRLRFLRQHPIQGIDLQDRLWNDNALEVDRVRAQLDKIPLTSVKEGMTFQAERPWLQPLKITKITHEASFQ